DTAATAVACAIYGLGLPAFVLQKVVQPLYFAREDTKRPFYYAVVAMVVNAGGAIGLSPFIGFIAAAIGATIAGWAMLALLWLGARSMGDAARFDPSARTRIWRICAASAIMGGALWVGQFLFSPFIEAENAFKFLGLALLVFFGIFSYAIAGFATKAFTKAEIRSALLRKG
ncbi:unnamed protein product, partial [Ectocarpus sp. 12 AP-2014]